MMPMRSKKQKNFSLILIGFTSTELDIEERLQWQESANSFFHRDFIGFLPPELACKVLDMLDAPTLLRCCQVPIFMIRVMQF